MPFRGLFLSRIEERALIVVKPFFSGDALCFFGEAGDLKCASRVVPFSFIGSTVEREFTSCGSHPTLGTASTYFWANLTQNSLSTLKLDPSRDLLPVFERGQLCPVQVL